LGEVGKKMFPIALDLKKTPIFLIGQGEAFEKRHKQLLEFGADQLTLRHTDASRYPETTAQLDTDFRRYDERIVMVAGLPYETSAQIANASRAAGKLVNVEDVNELCDFYFMANVKRGDLLIAVSTNGASPTLAGKIRDYIGKRFGAEWGAQTEELKNLRNGLKQQGKTMREVMRESEKFLHDKGWLNCTRCPKKDDV
jgi:precorrin-2 dehydrogenase/sirohydrochlorin ferrochelatase